MLDTKRVFRTMKLIIFSFYFEFIQVADFEDYIISILMDVFLGFIVGGISTSHNNVRRVLSSKCALFMPHWFSNIWVKTGVFTRFYLPARKYLQRKNISYYETRVYNGFFSFLIAYNKYLLWTTAIHFFSSWE